MSEPLIVRTGGQAVVTFDGDLTSSTVLEVRPKLVELMAAGVTEFVFDFRNTILVDSSGIGMLISAHNRVSKTGGKVEVVEASEEVASLFQAMRLDRRFRIGGKTAA
jgi:anti-anti-sigma factor